MDNTTVHIINWSIMRFVGPGYDPIVLHGDFCGHPSLDRGTPSSFLSFDKKNLLGKSISGKVYILEACSFRPTGFARTLEDACDWIEQNWVRKK